MRTSWMRALVLLGALAGAVPAQATGPAITFDMATDLQPLGGAFRFSVTPGLADGAAKPWVYLCPIRFDFDYFVASGDNKGKLTAASVTTAAKAAFGKGARLDAGDEETEEIFVAQKLRAFHACQRLDVQREPPDAGTAGPSNFVAAMSAKLPRSFVTLSETYISGLANPITNTLAREIVTGGWVQVWLDADTARAFEVGVTSRPFAAFGSIGTVLLFALGLAGFARMQRVPGPGKGQNLNLASLPIRLISTAGGRASLSQFQIMLWTFVVLGGAVYVVLLNGALIPLTSGTLVLLGISGAANLIAQAKDANFKATAQAITKPGAVEDVNVDDFPDSADLVVKWSPPRDVTPVQLYRVRYGTAAAAGQNQTYGPPTDVEDNGVRLIGLIPHIPYVITVCAVNSGGEGPAATAMSSNNEPSIVSGPTAPPPPVPPVAPPPPVVVNVLLDKVTENTIWLDWRARDGATGYEVQQRRADSLDDWSPAARIPDVGGLSAAGVGKLDSGVVYNFRVREEHSDGEWSAPVRAATLHRPRWSDLVTQPDRPNELEVTRVQMLLFTIVTAGFVTIKIADLSVIPDIPPEYLTLMGISNSVYLGGKWVRR